MAKLDLNRLRTYSLVERPSLVEKGRFARAIPVPAGFGDLWSSLPDFLGARDLKELARAIASARGDGLPCWLAFGGHVIKVGLAPLVVDLMEHGWITGLATHGAGAVHDYEVALAGRTSEDVALTVKDGSFGMARETADGLNEAAVRGARGEGLGRALGKLILEGDLPFKELSVFATAARLGLPLTVHVSVGCDIVHMHSCVDGGALGQATLRDFHLLCEGVADLEGGVWLNMGSAVILPEVFLKALTVARNLQGGRPARFVAANMDQIRHYRPTVNVLTRPVGGGIELMGQHEVLFPLLRLGVLYEREQLERGRGR